MATKTKHRIIYKQARIVLIISLLLGVAFTALQLFYDLKEEKKSLFEDINRITSLHQENAILAVYNLNRVQGLKITETIVAQPEIYRARLVDDFEEILAESRRVAIVNNQLDGIGEALFEIPEQLETSLTIKGLNHGSAKLIINLDSSYISSAFLKRAIVSLVFSLLYALVLVAALMLIFYHYLARPIIGISNWVDQLRLGNESQKLPYTERDEIGDLVSGFDSLWNERKQVADQLSATVQNLSKSEHFSRSLMDNAGDAMFLCLPDTTIVQVNQRAALSLGINKEQLVGQKLSRYSKNYGDKSLIKLFSSFSEENVIEFEDQQQGIPGRSLPIEARGIRLNLQNANYVLIMARDVTKRKESERKIHELAFYDALTGLPNRRLFLNRLEFILANHQDEGCFGAVLYLDLDHFKTINDSLGHGVGDALLCQISKRLTSILPANSTCSRFGGDEFIVLLPEVSDQLQACTEEVTNISQDILEQINHPYSAQGHTLYCSASIGIAMFPKNDNGPEDILRCADTALYRAKALGRNDFQFFDPEMQSSAQQRLDVEKGLHQALENQEFELWFQPQVEGTGKMVGVEALIRWNHPEKGIVMPGNFISIAEESGQIIEIGKWVLDNALQQLMQWVKEGLPEGFKRLAVNVSPIQFMQVDFVDYLFNRMDEYQVPGNMLELEITENALVNNFEVACNKMKLLKLRGISFAIDDFGTGYSSLRYLQHLPLDILKIDRSFVTDLSLESDKAAIIEVIITIADRLGLTVIAEGVETVQECEALKALGCPWFQGYLYSKPIPRETLYKNWVKAA
jgi:diguanylate cyclase (GGDEF)-like protein/PAS domain S-box-containing protein